VNGSHVQCGIVSFGPIGRCYDPNFPSVLARITALMPFIRENGGGFCVA
jgi:secreted trypsin-like serine protease